jgi:F-type H+-transporting ATPase subunit gamma
MPSLKTSGNRIASVKATQKITKAMQMVAAAKLRRAQEAAVAARPYSSAWAAVLATSPPLSAGRRCASAADGTGKDEVHLLVVCAERGLCGGFNSPDRPSGPRDGPQTLSTPARR